MCCCSSISAVQGLTLAAIFIGEAANTQMERNEEFFHQFFLSDHLMGIAETLAMVAALIALLMVIHVWWKSAVERRTKLRDLCIFNGIILLISVYELVAHGGLTAYRDEMPLHYFVASGHESC